MTDEIKKMLEPRLWATMADDVTVILTISKEDFDRLKRGFEELMEQRDTMLKNWHETHSPFIGDFESDVKLANAELEAVMKGEG